MSEKLSPVTVRHMTMPKDWDPMEISPYLYGKGGAINGAVSKTYWRARQAGFLTDTVTQLPDPDAPNKDGVVLGQNFFIDDLTMAEVKKYVKSGPVLEIGSGFAVFTELLAEDAESVTGIELDGRFEPVLSTVSANSGGKINFIYGNALEWPRLVDLDKFGSKPQIISNLPFAIAPQFMGGLVSAPIEDAIIFLGGKSITEIGAENPEDKNYGHMSPVSRFYNIELITPVEEGCFYPKRDTTGAIFKWTPKDSSEIGNDPATRIFSQIFLDSRGTLTPPRVLDSISRASGYPGDQTRALKEIHAARIGSVQPGTIEPDIRDTKSLLQLPFFNMTKPQVREFADILSHLK